MSEGIRTVIYPVKDLDRAKAFYALLAGGPPVADAPYYVGFEIAGQHVGLDPNGHSSGMTGPTAFWHVADIKATLATLVEAGAEVSQEPKNVGGGRLVGSVKDADGNIIGLIEG